MNPFYFYHSAKNLQPNLHTQEGQKDLQAELKCIAVWETCLRKIIFTEDVLPTQQIEKNNFNYYENEEALIFIIEVLCGLQSKVIGETEIFGQFKKFLTTDKAKNISFFKNSQFVQFLYKQVKEIRDQYITQLGVNSYGSLIRKICQNENEISLIGYGQLAQKILPWISNRKIKVHVRDKTKYKKNTDIHFLNLEENNFFSTLIVAAPIKSDQVMSILKLNDKNKLVKVVDCRSVEEKDQSLKKSLIDNSVEVIDLNDLFASIEAKQEKMKELLPLIQKEIKERVQSYLLKAQHRPLGWEDLCG